MHQNSRRRKQVKILRNTSPNGRRSPRKISFGQGLYMLVTPKGGRYWRYNYRQRGKQRTLALGVYPDVPVGRAQMRHQAARVLLARGVDSAVLKSELRRAGKYYQQHQS